ncbi:MAG: DEAD/DEAH box helicase [Planctomycetota bacterium]|nr:DEAD/DEAH box helicase [Planctomycetota bacterium]
MSTDTQEEMLVEELPSVEDVSPVEELPIVEELSGFAAMDLIAPIQQAIESAGYLQPSPIQLEAIPHILAGTDVIGQAETGSGKTAAFALPLLSRIDVSVQSPQVLVLTPTRELALQVSESFRQYSKGMGDLRVTAIYGGAGYDPQLQALERGMHVVVGTPGRVMDHMRRGTLNLQGLQCLVLDEADQMLQMGFIEDVEWVLTQTPQERQVILFSATIPPAIRRIAEQHLKNPQHITIRGPAATATSIRQRACSASPHEKLDILCRLLEAESVDGVLAFVKTRSMANTLAEQLSDRGYSSAALSGELAQSKRERTVTQFKNGRINVLVATDVAARGLDVDRISHVVNYDFPHNTEAYVHRIGRTGRAGRSGEAILFVGRHDKFKLRDLERGTRQRIEWMEKPSMAEVNQQRQGRLQQQLAQLVAQPELPEWMEWIQKTATELKTTPVHIAAALAILAQKEKKTSPSRTRSERDERPERSSERPRADRRSSEGDSYEKRPSQRHSVDRPEYDRKPVGRSFDRAKSSDQEFASNRSRSHEERDSSGGDRDRNRSARPPRNENTRDSVPPRRDRNSGRPQSAMTRYRIEAGRVHGVKPGNIVGALANEANFDTTQIGAIEVFDQHTTVDLGEMLTGRTLEAMQRIRVAGRPMLISLCDGVETGSRGTRPRTGKPSHSEFQRQGNSGAAGRPSARRSGGPSTGGARPTGPYKSKFSKGGKPAGKQKPVVSAQEKFRANFKKKLRRKAEGE